jgi:hypothetical protein
MHFTLFELGYISYDLSDRPGVNFPFFLTLRFMSLIEKFIRDKVRELLDGACIVEKKT